MKLIFISSSLGIIYYMRFHKVLLNPPFYDEKVMPSPACRGKFMGMRLVVKVRSLKRGALL